MARERAKWMDQASFWTVGTADAPGKWHRLPTAAPEPETMIAFTSFQGFIWGMSA